MDSALEFLSSDCIVVECISGLIHRDVGSGSETYRCPKCHRAQVQAPFYTGPLKLHAPQEMADRLEERKKLYFDTEYRRTRAIEVIRFCRETAEKQHLKELDTIRERMARSRT